jgi:8-oxo-dGTP pyrophosphatase MutT (NUDIX family)
MCDLPFVVDVVGPFGREQLRLVWRDEARPPHAGLDALVAETWAGYLDESRRKGFLLYNGQAVRHLRHELADGTLTIEAGPTDFAQFIATNYLNPHRAEEFGWDLYSNPIGVSAVVVTADGWILYGRRNERVACHPGHVQAFGGSLEADERRADGTFDAFTCILRELDEEAGVRPADVTELVCLGLIHDRVIRQPELVFDTRIRQDRAEMAGRLRHDDPGQEHAEIVLCRDEPEAIVPFIRQMTPMSPVAVGALFLHGSRQFGQAWYERASRDLCP